MYCRYLPSKCLSLTFFLQFGKKKFHAEPTGNPVPLKCQIKPEEVPSEGSYPNEKNPVYWFWYDQRHKGTCG